MTYINSAQGGDDATTYKGKIDESVNLLREPPVTAGTATAYTVAGWASITLTDGLIYTAKAHTANTGSATVAGVSAKNLDASALAAGQIQGNQVIHFLYQSSGPSFLLLNPSSKVAAITGGTATLSSLTVSNATALTGAEELLARIRKLDGTENPRFDFSVDNSAGEVIFSPSISSGTYKGVLRFGASNNAIEFDSTGNVTFPNGTVQVPSLQLGHASDTTLSRPAAGRMQLEGREVVTATASATQLTSTIPELNLLAGVTKVGDVVYNQALNPDSSFTSGSGWLTVIKTSTSNYLCTYTALGSWGHASASAVSTSGIIPAAYWPASFNECLISVSGSAIRRARVDSVGAITTQYLDWAGSLFNATSTGQGFTLSWVV